MQRKRTWQSWSTLFYYLAWVLGIIVMLAQSHSELSVAHRQQTTTAVITSHEESNHDQYRYSYLVGGKNYAGIGNAPSGFAVV